MFDYAQLAASLAEGPLHKLASAIPQLVAEGLNPGRHPEIAHWQARLASWPKLSPSVVDLQSRVHIGLATDLDSAFAPQFHADLQQLIPWRKGPFSLFGVDIDTEWRSDFKWDRVMPHLPPLADKSVLDVGCGSGYHVLRLAGAGAEQVIGIEPLPRFVYQFHALTHALPALKAAVLPCTLEQLPANMMAFDLVLSMGVLYHRRSPLDHLRELKDSLGKGGQLLL